MKVFINGKPFTEGMARQMRCILDNHMKQSNQFPTKAKRPRVEVWGLWDDTNKKWVGGSPDHHVKGSYEKCAGIMKLEKEKYQIIKFKIIPYDPNK